MTSRDFIRLNPTCAYCGQQARHRDHVVPRAMRRRHHIRDNDERYHVAACVSDNLRKLTHKLYPRGFDVTLLPGKGWIEWHGEPISQMYAK